MRSFFHNELVSRPGQSQGMLYKHRRNSFIHYLPESVRNPIPHLPLRPDQAQNIKITAIII